jgi:hypothetical protein
MYLYNISLAYFRKIKDQIRPPPTPTPTPTTIFKINKMDNNLRYFHYGLMKTKNCIQLLSVMH